MITSYQRSNASTTVNQLIELSSEISLKVNQYKTEGARHAQQLLRDAWISTFKHLKNIFKKKTSNEKIK